MHNRIRHISIMWNTRSQTNEAPLRNSRMGNEGPPLPPLSIPEVYRCWGKREKGSEKGKADKWSKRGILSRDISLSGIVEPPSSLPWTPKHHWVCASIKTWDVSLQMCEIICRGLLGWLYYYRSHLKAIWFWLSFILKQSWKVFYYSGGTLNQSPAHWVHWS